MSTQPFGYARQYTGGSNLGFGLWGSSIFTYLYLLEYEPAGKFYNSTTGGTSNVSGLGDYDVFYWLRLHVRAVDSARC